MVTLELLIDATVWDHSTLLLIWKHTWLHFYSSSSPNRPFSRASYICFSKFRCTPTPPNHSSWISFLSSTKDVHQLVSRAIQAFAASILLVWVRFLVHTCVLLPIYVLFFFSIVFLPVFAIFSWFCCSPPFDIEATWISIDSSCSTPCFISVNMF